ncbi:MAG TPA: outer membrane beta-barrel protein [Nitrospirales bacterium]|jgi:opacity protein-like surface antigen
MKRLLTFLPFALLLGTAAISAAAQTQIDPYHVTGNTVDLETYAKLFGGATFDGRLRNLQFTGPSAGISASPLALKSSLLYGIKLGVFPWRWVGMEVEAFHSTPHTKQQTAIIRQAGTSISGTVAGIDQRVTVLAFNAIVRYPGRILQPYIGIGPALFFARVKDSTGSDSDTTVGFNAQAGLNVRLGQRFGVFGEYKYDWAQFTYGSGNSVQLGLKGVYSNNALVAGVSWYF